MPTLASNLAVDIQSRSATEILRLNGNDVRSSLNDAVKIESTDLVGASCADLVAVHPKCESVVTQNAGSAGRRLCRPHLIAKPDLAEQRALRRVPSAVPNPLHISLVRGSEKLRAEDNRGKKKT